MTREEIAQATSELDFTEIRKSAHGNETYYHILRLYGDRTTNELRMTTFYRNDNGQAEFAYNTYYLPEIIEEWNSYEPYSNFPHIGDGENTAYTNKTYVGKQKYAMLNLVYGTLEYVEFDYISLKDLLYINSETGISISALDYKWSNLDVFLTEQQGLVTLFDEKKYEFVTVLPERNEINKVFYNGKLYSSHHIVEYYNYTDVNIGDKVSQLIFEDRKINRESESLITAFNAGTDNTNLCVVTDIQANTPYILVTNPMGCNFRVHKGMFALKDPETMSDFYSAQSKILPIGTTVTPRGSTLKGVITNGFDGYSFVEFDNGKSRWYTNSSLNFYDIPKQNTKSDKLYNETVTAIKQDKESLHITPNDITVGREYYVKPWDTMTRLYGVNSNNEPCFITRFTKQMSHLCGRKVLVKDIVNNNTIIAVYKDEEYRLAIDTLKLTHEKCNVDLVEKYKSKINATRFFDTGFLDHMQSGYYFIIGKNWTGWYTYVENDALYKRLFSMQDFTKSIMFDDIETLINNGEISVIAYAERPTAQVSRLNELEVYTNVIFKSDAVISKEDFQVLTNKAV